jgi:chemotaxis protein methyltransferase CheR
MRITDFDVYRDLLKEKSGLILVQDQSYLLDSRLMPIAKKWGYTSLDAMTATLQGVPDKDLVYDVIEAMTTKDTSFFRDAWPFHMFRDDMLTHFRKTRAAQKKIKIWCSAASTGQEAYSLALMFKERQADFNGWKIDILASDISSDSLEQSKLGIFSQFEVQRGLSVRTLLQYFKQIDDNNWQIAPDIRKMIRHQTFNLLDNMGALGKFDMILCRNVLGEFDEPTRKRTIEKLAGQLEKDGFLMLGRGEKIAEGGPLRPMHQKRGIYVLQDSPHQTIAMPAPQTLAKSAV